MSFQDADPTAAREKPRRRFKKRYVLGAFLLVMLIALVAIIIPVYRITTAVPAGGSDALAQLERLAEDNQSPGVAPSDPNVYPMLLALIEREQAFRAEWNERISEESTRRFGESYKPVRLTPAAVWDPAVPSTNIVETFGEERERMQPAINAMHAEFVREYLSALEQEGVFTALDEIARTPRAVRPFTEHTGMLLAILLPDLGPSRFLARLEHARLELAVREGDEDTVVNAIEHTLALSGICARQPIMISRLVGLAIASLAAEGTRDAILNIDMSEPSLARLLELWIAHDSIPPPSFAIDGERHFLLDTVAWTYSDDGKGSGYALPVELAKLDGSGGIGVSSPSAGNILGLLLARRDEILRIGGEIYDDYMLAADTPRRDRSGVNFRHDVASFPRRHMLLHIMLPSIGYAIRAEDRAACARAGTQTLLAIEIHRARAGALPESLDDLVPQILSALPEDPYARDGRFIYRPLAGPDEHGRDYLLYSVAADSTDDGGVPEHTGGPENAFKTNFPGTDYLFTPVPPPANDRESGEPDRP